MRPQDAASASRGRATPGDAGFWLRVGAKLLDHALWAFVEIGCIALGTWLNALDYPPWVIASGWVLSALLWYGYVFELTRRRGQTLGKMAGNIRVIAGDGHPPRTGVMLRRIIVEALFDQAAIPCMVLGWAIGRATGADLGRATLLGGGLGTALSLLNPLYILRSQQRQALHDRVAGTYVVRVDGERIRGFAALAVVGALLPQVAVFVVVRPLLVEAYWVPSGSMEPTIQIGDRILANKLVPRLRLPRRGEVVMFRAPQWVTEKGMVFVKRVVGIPGDVLQVKDGKLWRNGQPVDEPYVMEPPTYTWPRDAQRGGKVTVPEGAVVVLGDNRNNSNDSHTWERRSADGRSVEPAPFLPVESIRGMLMYRFWPPDRMGVAGGETQEARRG